MSPAHVLEPTYLRLKRIVRDGEVVPGTKLEAQRLADELGVSMTPVRDSLNRLVGEGLVDFFAGEGYRTVTLTEQNLRDMLRLNAALLDISIAETRANREDSDQSEAEHYADRVAAALRAYAGLSGNRFLVDTVAGISDRIHQVRLREPKVLVNASDLLESLEVNLDNSAESRSAAVSNYHEACLGAVPRLISELSKVRG